jgi:hypothetical protein
MTMAGVAAYYTSAPSATGELAWPVTSRIQTELRPLITPTLAVMRTWRLAKRVRARFRRNPHRLALRRVTTAVEDRSIR